MALAPNKAYEAEKSLWTEKDFERMGWHDVRIHAMAFDAESCEIRMDLDYIFAWVDPTPGETHYTFWMAPSTLAFSKVDDFTAQIDWGIGFQIEDVIREAVVPEEGQAVEDQPNWLWTFRCQEGQFAFRSAGYRQFTRTKPVRSRSQAFSWAERKGVCFDLRTYDGDDSEPGAAPNGDPTTRPGSSGASGGPPSVS